MSKLIRLNRGYMFLAIMLGAAAAFSFCAATGYVINGNEAAADKVIIVGVGFAILAIISMIISALFTFFAPTPD